MEVVVVLTLLIMIVFPISIIISDRKRRSLNVRNLKAIRKIENFNPVVAFAGRGSGPGVAIDPETRKFAIVLGVGYFRLYDFPQLVNVEAVRNGLTVQQTNRGSQLGGAAIGAVLFGPVGLLLGGLTGSKRNVEKVKWLSLKLFTNDLMSPVTELIFFDDRRGVKPDSFQVKQAASELEKWYGRFQTILHAQSIQI